jgi:hypothetical protein
LGRDFARALDPVALARDCGIEPDDWQSNLLRGNARKELLLCSRQSGKSTATALVALHEALYSAPALVLLVSPSLRQSTELFRKVTTFWRALSGAPKASQESLTSLSMSNGSRIVSLPGSEGTVRGYSAARLVIIDEAARVTDDLLTAVRPALATTNGRLIALSTPAGRRGWFWEAWDHGDAWSRTKITAAQCPRLSAEFLEDERRLLGELRYAAEYVCEFVDDDTAVFNSALINAAFKDTVKPLWPAAA